MGDEVLVPSASAYESMLGVLDATESSSAMPRCNCTACDSCRCSCSCGRCGDPSCSRCRASHNAVDPPPGW